MIAIMINTITVGYIILKVDVLYLNLLVSPTNVKVYNIISYSI